MVDEENAQNQLDRHASLLWGETRSPIALPLNASSGAYVSYLLVKSGQAKLYGLSGYNSKTSAQFIHVYDAFVQPTTGDVPKVVVTVPATSNFSIDWSFAGRTFRNGIFVANSSTGPTYTAGSADCWFDVQYI